MLNKNSFIGFFLPEEAYGFMSNWYPAKFSYAGKTYAHVEQYMMYQKVMTFGQYDLAEKIMATEDPKECKDLGRTRFPEFDGKVWEKIAKQVVKRGVRAKFVCNPDLLEQLLNTSDSLLAECSPYDKRWGIGIGPDDPNRFNVSMWQGDNWMGQIMMEVREELRRVVAHFGSADVLLLLDHLDQADPGVWEMTAGELKRIPWFYPVIHAYADTLYNGLGRVYFYHSLSMKELEKTFQVNQGGGLPGAGFYELKQDVFETAIIHSRKDN